MNSFGAPRLITLTSELEPGIDTYMTQISYGLRPDNWRKRFAYLLQANFAYNYLNGLRKRSNNPRYIALCAHIERILKHPLHTLLPKTKRAAEFFNKDIHFERNIIDVNLVDRFKKELSEQSCFYDPYLHDFRYSGSLDKATHPFLYMQAHDIFKNQTFLRLAASQGIVNYCREVLGPSATLSWAWTWFSIPSAAPYQNQNWHRDSGEPFNFIRIFIPLNDVDTLEDGPTEVIIGTSGLPECYEVRRYNEDEVASVKASRGSVFATCKRGDVYFCNTFSLHHGTPPNKIRGMLTMLVTLIPSNRTPTIPKVALYTLPPDLQEQIKANKSFFRHIVE